ncbi:MAG: acyltransferase domain-containing protein, partial [bacterium]|nr:acyltransferase domain-containing protein [bacterium]
AEIWQQILGVSKIGFSDNFFDLGGNSLIGLQVTAALQQELGRQVLPVALYEAPTVRELARYLNPERASGAAAEACREARHQRRQRRSEGVRRGIAIIGMAGRFPEARGVEQLWQNLLAGREGITFFSDEELLAAGVEPAVLADPRYVKAGSVLADVDRFDAELFAVSPREAELMDPQHRLFLECAWEALDDGGYDALRYPGSIGVYGGSDLSTYLLQIAAQPELAATLHQLQAGLGNSNDSLTTRVSYKLNLRGPSVAVQTFCSTSAVAAHMACESLLRGECDMALAGGVRINVPHRVGYLHEPGGIASPDGHTRTFDVRAQGAVVGSGVALVLLKPLAEAQRDGDHVYAVIRGSAVNNDGAGKVGYTAPSVGALAEVVGEALEEAAVDPSTISYVEAHGTATELGDPIELAALTRAFRAHTSEQQFCAIGSVKSNLGHLDRAAGATALIKTALALERGVLPPSLHFEKPNPELELAASPFYVQTERRRWESRGTPRRAAVNALGIGGTNACFVLEQPPAPDEPSSSRPCQLLVLSANTAPALETMTDRLAEHLRSSAAELADVAFTLQQGRRILRHRRMLVCGDREEAWRFLESRDAVRVLTHEQEAVERPLAFLFPGLGDHYPNMAEELYRGERIFREAVDRCCRLLEAELGLDLREVILPPREAAEPSDRQAQELDLRRLLRRGGDQEDGADRRLNETWLTQPAVFVVEWALAQLLLEWGLVPQAMLGHSLGEYVAATVAGVFSLADALLVVARRARLIDGVEAGAMLAVPLGEDEARELLGENLSLAALNSRQLAVLAGPVAAIEALEARLGKDGVAAQRVRTSHAFHSHMMDEIAGSLVELVRGVELRPPSIPYLSNVTGTWIGAEEATDPSYWGRHLCAPVRFADALGELLSEPDQLFAEVGPGQTLGSFVQQHPAANARVVVGTLRGAHVRRSDREYLLGGLGKLWLAGAAIDWQGFYRDERRRRVPLPSYPFAGERYWIGGRTAVHPAARPALAAGKKPDPADWFYRPGWRQVPLPLPEDGASAEGSWLLFIDDCGVGSSLAAALTESADPGPQLTLVRRGAGFEKLGDNAWALDPACREDYRKLLRALPAAPSRVVHLWSLTSGSEASFDELQEVGLYSLLHLGRALGEEQVTSPVRLDVVANHLHQVLDGEPLAPGKATLISPCKVLPQEFPSLTCRTIDLGPEPGGELGAELLAELVRTPAPGPTPWGDRAAMTLEVAWRDGKRFARSFEPVRVEPPATPGGGARRLRQRGVYLITGGLGGVGLVLAQELAGLKARLVLLGRRGLPAREEWASWLDEHGDDDLTSRKIRRIEALEELGAEVLVLAADVADRGDLRRVLETIDETFGELHGVLHAAGVSGREAFLPAQQTGAPACELHFRPKVRGLEVLAAALEGRALDFCLLFSSLSSVLGGLGFTGYAAANLFMDSFARVKNGAVAWLAVSWDSWQVAAASEAQERGLEATILEFAMSPEEGIAAFRRALASDAGPVLVHSTGDLASRIDQWLLRTALSSGAAERAERSAYSRPALATAYVPVRSDTERRVARIFAEVLGIAKVGINDNYFDLGGTSLTAIQVVGELQKDFAAAEITPLTLFEAPSVAELARHLDPPAAGGPSDRLRAAVESSAPLAGAPGTAGEAVAIIGLSARFPGARTVEEFWRNLTAGVESLSFFSAQELRASGVGTALSSQPEYVPARPVLEDVDLFDAGFFSFSPREAELMDPQMRLLLEGSWEALESAGYGSDDGERGRIGMFAGSNISSYMLGLAQDPSIRDSVGELEAAITNDRDSLATTVSYKLNLRGPSLTVQTFCSTSAVATHLACRSLRGGECDMALAAGVSLRVPVKVGYLYRAGDLCSPDGHTRTFDHQAQGTVFGDGVGVVVLKRLSAAQRDGDRIHAVIRGSAVNNDGSLKAGYTAPSVEGQATAVASALRDAGVSAAEIDYVEAHGTATVLGDPIEVKALTQAFRLDTQEKGYCAIGSVKTNVGHLDRAAGVAALIKTALALEHALIPASLHFERPNPEIDFAGSPFYVNAELAEWPVDGRPRRAGINCLGVGGTNVHLVLEEAPPSAPPESASRPCQLLLLSARSAAALDQATSRLARHLRDERGSPLADVAYTLQLGRKVFAHRRMLVCADREDAIAALENPAERVVDAVREPASRQVAFLFPGIGEHYAGMARGLYTHEAVFREEVDRCAALLCELGYEDLLAVLYPGSPDEEPHPETQQGKLDLRRMLRGGEENEADRRLGRIRHLHPALFVVEWALARLLINWGLEPQAMLGYSLGEYVAACLAGVFSLADALRLVAARGRWIDELPEGAMLAVQLTEEEMVPLLGEELDLAAVNGPGGCVVSGSPAAVAGLEGRLAERQAVSRRLRSSRAFHSRHLGKVAARVGDLLSDVELRPPEIPFLSNVSGTWITPQEATDPQYWARHLCLTVRFNDALGQLLSDPERLLVEVGPGQGLSSFARLHPACGADPASRVRPTLPALFERRPDQACLLENLGRLWLCGAAVDWQGFYRDEQRRRRRLPTYPFERRRFWLEPDLPAGQTRVESLDDLHREPEVEDWFYLPQWERSAAGAARKTEPKGPCWAFVDGRPAGQVEGVEHR